MAERAHKPKAEQKTEVEDSTIQALGNTATSEHGEALKSELDDLLDEIDEVLESNAEDFVKSYVQKGGQ